MRGSYRRLLSLSLHQILLNVFCQSKGDVLQSLSHHLKAFLVLQEFLILLILVVQHIVIETDDDVTVVQLKSFTNQVVSSFFMTHLHQPTIVQSLQ